MRFFSFLKAKPEPPIPLRQAVEGAHAWMLASLPIGAPFDEEVDRCGVECRRRRDDLYIGAGLGALLAFVGTDKTTAKYAEWTLTTIRASVVGNPVLAMIALEFSKYCLSDERDTNDFDRITGDFVLNNLGMSAPASDRLRGYCSDEETRSRLGRQILLRANFCLKGYLPSYWTSSD